MEEQQRKEVSRKVYRSHLTRLLSRNVHSILNSGTKPTETQIATVTSSIEQLTERCMNIRELDNQIAATIGKEDELHGGKIIEAEVTHEFIHCLLQILCQRLIRHVQ